MPSQYAAFPKENAHLVKQHYNVAGIGAWEITAHGQQWLGVENEPEFTDEQIEEIHALGGALFATTQSFINWIQR